MESNNKKVHYICAECGSTNVMLNAWVDPNNDNLFLKRVENDFDGWCKRCEGIVKFAEVDEVVCCRQTGKINGKDENNND